MSDRHQIFSWRFLFSLMLALLFIISCKHDESKRNEVIENYGNGQMSRRYTTINGMKEGLMTDYYPGGKLKGERMFKNDMQVDKSMIYYESGIKKEVQYFKDGKLNGGDSTFYENGQPKMLINFTDGIKNGYIRSWGEDGAMTYEAKLSMDTLVEVKGVPIVRDSSNHQVIHSRAKFK
ncbi:MAG: hypothetical protein ABJC12_04800 [Saprospiraceae bacterium]